MRYKSTIDLGKQGAAKEPGDIAGDIRDNRLRGTVYNRLGKQGAAKEPGDKSTSKVQVTSQIEKPRNQVTLQVISETTTIDL